MSRTHVAYSPMQAVLGDKCSSLNKAIRLLYGQVQHYLDLSPSQREQYSFTLDKTLVEQSSKETQKAMCEEEHTVYQFRRMFSRQLPRPTTQLYVAKGPCDRFPALTAFTARLVQAEETLAPSAVPPPIMTGAKVEVIDPELYRTTVMSPDDLLAHQYPPICHLCTNDPAGKQHITTESYTQWTAAHVRPFQAMIEKNELAHARLDARKMLLTEELAKKAPARFRRSYTDTIQKINKELLLMDSIIKHEWEAFYDSLNATTAPVSMVRMRVKDSDSLARKLGFIFADMMTKKIKDVRDYKQVEDSNGVKVVLPNAGSYTPIAYAAKIKEELAAMPHASIHRDDDCITTPIMHGSKITYEGYKVWVALKNPDTQHRTLINVQIETVDQFALDMATHGNYKDDRTVLEQFLEYNDFPIRELIKHFHALIGDPRYVTRTPRARNAS